MRRKHDNAYLHFTRKERTGIIALLIFVVLLLLIPFIYPLIFKETISPADEYLEDIARLKEQSIDSASPYNNFDKKFPSYEKRTYNSQTIKSELFYFDPNTISADQWSKLGVKDKTIATIQNYLSKGGRFREANDLEKIWGLYKDQADRMKPFVRIVPTTEKNYFKKQPTVYEPKAVINVDINTADSNSFISLPGIGPALSKRIINYRSKLGGFYSPDQVKETYGLPDSVFQKIRPLLQLNSKAVKTININLATIDDLKSHPYIKYHLANAIFQYRQQHGNFTSLTDLRNIMLMNEETYMKLSPYLTLE